MYYYRHQNYHHNQHPYVNMEQLNHWQSGYGGDYFQATPENPLDNTNNYTHLRQDKGKEPFTININNAARHNQTYRTAIWTGAYLQITLMSIQVGEDIGLEIHHDHDQFLRIEEGHGLAQMGKRKDQLDFIKDVYNDSAIVVPAGTWHNITNVGYTPLKLYSIYAPPEHPFGTVHRTKADALAVETYNDREREE